MSLQGPMESTVVVELDERESVPRGSLAFQVLGVVVPVLPAVVAPVVVIAMFLLRVPLDVVASSVVPVRIVALTDRPNQLLAACSPDFVPGQSVPAVIRAVAGASHFVFGVAVHP